MMIINRKRLVTSGLLAVLALTLVISSQLDNKNEELVEAGNIDSPKIIGEATLVDASQNGEVTVETGSVSSNYFADSRVSRQQARDSAIEILQTVVNDSEADDDSKKNAADDIGVIATIITKENAMESIIKAKGFEDAVVIMGESDITVVVKTDSLEASEISTIKEVVMSETTAKPEQIKIVEIE